MQVDELDNKHVGYKAIEDPASAQGPPGGFLYFMTRRGAPCGYPGLLRPKTRDTRKGYPYKLLWGS